MFRVTLVVALLLQMGLSSAAVDVFLSETFLLGSSAYFTVKRTAVQQRLQELNQISNGIQYYLPRRPPTIHLFESDEHVIQIVLVQEEALSFSNAITKDDEYTTASRLFAVVIPYLSTTEGGPARVSLLLHSFRSRTDHGRSVIDANVVIPAEVEEVDELVMTKVNHLVFRSGDLSLELREREFARHCNYEPPREVIDSGLFGYNPLASLAGPDFSVCEARPPLSVDLCDVYRHSKSEIEAAGNNVCEYLRAAVNDLSTCPTVFEIVSASPRMRELLFMTDDTRKSVTATLQRGLFSVYLKAPCYTEPAVDTYTILRRYFTF